MLKPSPRRTGLWRACTRTMALGQARRLVNSQTCLRARGARLYEDTGVGKVLGVHSKDGSAVWR